MCAVTTDVGITYVYPSTVEYLREKYFVNSISKVNENFKQINELDKINKNLLSFNNSSINTKVTSLKLFKLKVNLLNFNKFT